MGFNDPKLVTVHFDDIVHETDKAVLVDIDGEEVWLPFSQIEIDRETMTIQMPIWLAEEKEIEFDG